MFLAANHGAKAMGECYMHSSSAISLPKILSNNNRTTWAIDAFLLALSNFCLYNFFETTFQVSTSIWLSQWDCNALSTNIPTSLMDGLNSILSEVHWASLYLYRF